jgi:hypothetical protein
LKRPIGSNEAMNNRKIREQRAEEDLEFADFGRRMAKRVLEEES